MRVAPFPRRHPSDRRLEVKFTLSIVQVTQSLHLHHHRAQLTLYIIRILLRRHRLMSNHGMKDVCSSIRAAPSIPHHLRCQITPRSALSEDTGKALSLHPGWHHILKSVHRLLQPSYPEQIALHRCRRLNGKRETTDTCLLHLRPWTKSMRDFQCSVKHVFLLASLATPLPFLAKGF